MKLKQNYWDYNFKEGFFITEESLYKIKDIIEKRLKEIQIEKPTINFVIERKDWLMFTTTEINQIVNEYNWSKDFIVRVIIVYDTDEHKIALHFDPKEETNFYIEWFSKDFIILLSWDLKDYLHNDVLIFRKFNLKKRTKEILLIIMFLIFFYIFYSLYKINNIDLTNILKSEDINEKLNFLIQYRKNQDQFIPLWFILIPFLLPILISLFAMFFDYFYPRNIFYIWQVKKSYDKKVSFRNYIIWTIIIWWLLVWFLVNYFYSFLWK